MKSEFDKHSSKFICISMFSYKVHMKLLPNLTQLRRCVISQHLSERSLWMIKLKVHLFSVISSEMIPSPPIFNPSINLNNNNNKPVCINV